MGAPSQKPGIPQQRDEGRDKRQYERRKSLKIIPRPVLVAAPERHEQEAEHTGRKNEIDKAEPPPVEDEPEGGAIAERQQQRAPIGQEDHAAGDVQQFVERRQMVARFVDPEQAEANGPELKVDARYQRTVQGVIVKQQSRQKRQAGQDDDGDEAVMAPPRPQQQLPGERQSEQQHV